MANQLQKDKNNIIRYWMTEMTNRIPTIIFKDELHNDIYDLIVDLLLDYSYIFTTRLLPNRELKNINDKIDKHFNNLKIITTDELFTEIIIWFIVITNDIDNILLQKELYEALINKNKINEMINDNNYIDQIN